MKALNRSYGVALVLIVLVCSFARCKLPGGPFVTVTIVGIPKESNKLVMTAVLDDATHTVDATPSITQLQLTLNMPPGARGSLKVSAQASVKNTPCILANGAVNVELLDDIAYEAILIMADAPLDGCKDVPTVNTVGFTLKKVESGGTGSVISNPAGILCASDCTEQSASFRPDTSLTLTARPAIGTQVRWTGADCNDSRVCTVRVAKDTVVTATFSPCMHGWCDEGLPDVTSNLYGVWGTSNNSVYAVGEGGKILRRTGGRWDLLTSGVSVPLRAIGAEKGGGTMYVGGDGGTLLKLNGNTVSVVDLPLVKDKQITGIVGDKNGIFDQNLNIYLCTADGGFFYKKGTDAWSAISSTALINKVLNGVSATNGFGGREAAVVGEGGFVLRWTDSGGSRDNTNIALTSALRGVWSGGSLSVAVGDNGVVITRSTGDYNNNAAKIWTVVDHKLSTNRLNAVWGGSDNTIWLVGEGGVILKYDGNMTVALQPNVPKVDLNGVWAADTDPTHVYAVGRNGAILHYVGP